MTPETTRQKITLNERGPGVLDGRQVRAMAFAHARDDLLDQVLSGRHLAHGQARALVVGGGYSPLAASLRDRGLDTTAIDSSTTATTIARETTDGVTFRTAPPTALGVEPRSFDLVYCADTLEVASDLDAVMASLSSALRQGGTLILDTVTDTVIAKLIYLLAFQRLPFTQIMPPGRYSAARLRNPRDVELSCAAVGLTVDSVIGFEPASVSALVKAILDRRSGRITDAALPQTAGFHLSEEGHAPVVTYFAIATKR